MNKIQLIAGLASQDIAKKISLLLKIPIVPTETKKFANGEIYTQIRENVRGNDIFVIQSTSSPVNDNLMELLILIDALKRASAGRINLVCPFLAYCRQDRKATSREPITAKLVANLISKAGADRLITVDLHADQIQGFYDIPVDHLVGYPLIAKYLRDKKYGDIVVVAPDIGSVKRANKLADLLGAPLAIIDKIRKQHNKAEVAHIIGDVKNKTALMIDDMIDTGGSIIAAAEELKKHQVKKIIVGATHGIFSNGAMEKLQNSSVDKILILNTIEIHNNPKKIEIISIAPLLAKVIRRIHQGKSLGSLFKWEEKQIRL